MQTIPIFYNQMAGISQSLDPSLQAVISQIVASMTAAFTEIKGATWSAATDTLEDISDAVAAVPANVSNINIDGLLTLKESLIAHNAALAGKMLVGGGTISFRNTSDTKNVIVATMDAGSRSAVVLDVT